MRTPTADAYAWHAKAMAGENPPVTYEPQCGWFVKRDSKDGPFIPCSIYLEQPIDEETGELLGDEVLLCECGGVQCDPMEAWTWLAKRPISKSEYDCRLAELITGETEALPF